MNRVVRKFPFEVSDEFRLTMPTGAKVLSVGVHENTPCVWAAVDLDAPSVARSFRIAGTGLHMDGFPGTATFVGTVLLCEGRLVFHLWDLGDGS